MLSHSFDRFYVVMKIEIPKVSDLNLTLFQFDYICSHVVNIEKGTKLYAGHVNKWFEMYSSSQGANYYAIHSLLYLRTIHKNILKCMKDL